MKKLSSVLLIVSLLLGTPGVSTTMALAAGKTGGARPSQPHAEKSAGSRGEGDVPLDISLHEGAIAGELSSHLELPVGPEGGSAAETAPEQPLESLKLMGWELSEGRQDRQRVLSMVFEGWRKAMGADSRMGTGSLVERGDKMASQHRKEELFVPDFYRGRIDLGGLARLQTELSPQAQERVDALKALIAIGLRPKGLKPEDEAAALAPLREPSEALKAMLEELHLDPAKLETAVLDAHRIDRDNHIPPEVKQRVSDLGLWKLKLPQEYGGLHLDQREYGQVLSVLPMISGSLAAPITAQNTIGSAPLAMYGTEAQRRKYFKLFADGAAAAAFGLTEPRAGTDLHKLATTAELSADGKTWKLLGGQKIFITGAPDAGLLYAVAGKTMVQGVDIGPTVFEVPLPFKLNESREAKEAKLLELDRKGLRLLPFTGEDGLNLMMIRGSGQGFIEFHGFELAVENVIGRPGKGMEVPLNSLNAGRIGFGNFMAASSKWFARKALERAVDREMFDDYSPKKGQAGTQADMEHVQIKLGRMQTKAAALKAVSDVAAALIDANPGMGIAALSAAIKARVSRQNWEIAQDALELGGGHSLIQRAPSSLELAFRDSWIALIVEGVNPAMAQFVHLMGGSKVQREMTTAKGVGKFLWYQLLASTPGILVNGGALPYRQAKWIQRRAALFALQFGVTALVLGKGRFAKRQNTLIRAYDVFMDLFTLGAVQTKLYKKSEREPFLRRFATRAAFILPWPVFFAGLWFMPFWAAYLSSYVAFFVLYALAKGNSPLLSKLPGEEQAALEGAAKVLKSGIFWNLWNIHPWGNRVDNVEREVGKAAVEAERARKGSRPNVVERHMEFLEGEMDGYFAKLYAKAGIEAPVRVRAAAPAEPSKKRFKLPDPNFTLMWVLGYVNRWLMLKGPALARRIPLIREIPVIGRGYFWIQSVDIPQADRERLRRAVNPNTAAFLDPNHSEFGTDWMIDKEIFAFVAPRALSWAAASIMRMGAGFWSKNNLIANDGGELAKNHAVNWALQGHGSLAHGEGRVTWTGDKAHEEFLGNAEMAIEAKRRAFARGDSRPVYLAPLVWKLHYTRDVSRRMRAEMTKIERSLGLKIRASGVVERFQLLQESILLNQMGRFNFDPSSLKGHDFFARQEAFRVFLVRQLMSRHPVRQDDSLDRLISRLKKEIVEKEKADKGAFKEDLEMVEEARRLGGFSRDVYSTERLSQEQIFESLKRVRADLIDGDPYDKLNNMLPRPYGPRVAHIRVPEPIEIDLTRAMGSEAQRRTYAIELADRARKAKQDELDEINREVAPEVGRFSRPNPFATRR